MRGTGDSPSGAALEHKKHRQGQACLLGGSALRRAWSREGRGPTLEEAGTKVWGRG